MFKKLIFVISLLLSVFLFSTNAKAETKEDIDRYINELANEYSICPELIQAMIENESSYNPKAINSNHTCYGLMQINKSVHKARMKELNVTDLTDAYSNILVGIDFISDLYAQYEDTAVVLMAYNEGNKGITRAQKGKVSGYAKKITERAAELEEIHGKIEHGFG